VAISSSQKLEGKGPTQSRTRHNASRSGSSADWDGELCVPLPVNYRAIVGIESRHILPGLAHLRFQLVFVNRDSEARIGE
jgi:hypothetical protein